MNTTTRNATLADMLALLQDQHARKIDVVAPAASIRAVEGRLTIRGTEPVITDDGVTAADGVYVPTAVADEGLADRLGVPVAYLKRLRVERPDLYDANVNGWLHGRRPLVRKTPEYPQGTVVRPEVPGDSRSFLVRAFRGDNGGEGIARAVLSNRYQIVDNLDVLMACLDGVRAAGVQVDVQGGDLTDRRMVLRVSCPEVAALAPRLLDGYRSPFTGATGADNPTVFAGFMLSNSETGGGAFTITPRLVVQVCNNGMTMTKDAMRTVHAGGRLEEGTIRWAADTQQKNLELVQAKTRDAVTTFLNGDYLTDAVARLEARAGEEVGTSEEAVREVTKPLGYTQDQVAGIMDYFVRGAQFTRAGVVNAITAYSQTVEDGDAAHDLDARATQLLGV